MIFNETELQFKNAANLSENLINSKCSLKLPYDSTKPRFSN